MSRQHVTSAATDAASTGTSRRRATLIALVLAAGALTVIAVLLWKPWPERNSFDYAQLEPARDAVLVGSVIDGIGFAAAAIALGLAVCLLAPARGAGWANAGAMLTALAGIAFSAAIISSGVLVWYTTATEAIPAETGTALLAFVEDNLAQVGALQVLGFLGFSLGALLLAVALWRARSVPRWLPIAFAVLTLAPFSGVSGRALDGVQIAHMAVLVIVAGYLLRQARNPARS